MIVTATTTVAAKATAAAAAATANVESIEAAIEHQTIVPV